MKRFLGFLLVISMMLSLCACNGTFQSNEGSNDNDTCSNQSEIERRLLELPPEDGKQIQVKKLYNCRTTIDNILAFARGNFPVIHVKYLGKTVNLESTEKRAEYKFEVIEWIRGGGDTLSQISAYSSVHVSQISISPDPQETRASEMYYYEFGKGYTYDIGEEYILCPKISDDGVLYINPYNYIPVRDETAKIFNLESLSVWISREKYDDLPLSCERLVAFLKQIIEKYKDYEGDWLPDSPNYVPPDDGDTEPSDSPSDTPSDSADSASGG